MSYHKRLALSGLAAFVIHVLLMSFVAWVEGREADLTIGMAATRDPIVIDLRPDQTVRRLIDTPIPAEGPVDPATDLISDQNSKASDLADVEGTRLAPFMEHISDFDELGGPKAPIPSPAAPPKSKTDGDSAQSSSQKGALAAALDEPARPAPPPDEPLQVARAEPPPAPDSEPVPAAERPAIPRGRLDGGVRENRGFIGFEAFKDELAPYLKEVRRKVEGRWRAALHTRYSGARATRAVLDCAIAPDGALVHVKIVEPGDSPTYAPLCKEAIERAAPFGPFPFEVPSIYRSKNLEIRWTFSFFM